LDWYYPNKQSVSANSIKVRDYFRTLFSNTTFINGLALAAGNNVWIVEEHYNNMLDYINKLIKLIDQDLKSTK